LTEAPGPAALGIFKLCDLLSLMSAASARNGMRDITKASSSVEENLTCYRPRSAMKIQQAETWREIELIELNQV